MARCASKPHCQVLLTYAPLLRLLVITTLKIVATVFVLAVLVPSTLHAQRDYRGMGLDLSSPHQLVNESILDLQQIGTNVVAIDIPLMQSEPNASSVAVADGGTLMQQLAAIEPIVDSIQNAGMNVFLRPSVSIASGERSALIAPSSSEDWFSSYRTAINGIAEFANTKNVALLGVGYELNALEDSRFEEDWRTLIADVRTTYSGELTYAASHTFDFDTDGGYEDLPWWDALDVVGINAYAPPVFSPSAVPEELQIGWESLADDIESWQSRSGLSQKIVFTEVGYQSTDGGASSPQELAEPVERFRIDLNEQAAAYDALIQAMDARGDWWGGAFFEGWESDPLAGGADTLTYTVQQKPAEDIVADFFGGRATFSARSSLLASWEDDFESWHTPGELISNTGSLMLEDEQGVTDGGTSLTLSSSGLLASRIWTFDGSNEYTLLSMASANPEVYQLEFDVTVDLSQVPSGGATAMQFVMEDHNNSEVSVDVPIEIPAGDDGLATVRVFVPFAEFGELVVDSLFYEMDFGPDNSWTGDVWVDNLRLTTTVAGDVTVNGVTDCRDIDAISFFVRNGLINPQYDVNGDGQTDAADRAAWFEATNILPGDLDLNGSVEFADFLVLSSSFGLAGNYCEGDVDGDRMVAFADFLALSTNFGQTSSASLVHVPEPSFAVCVVLVPALLRLRRRAKR